MAKVKTNKPRAIFGNIWAVCTPDEKSVINRVLVKGGKLIATDSYILAIRDIPEGARETLADVQALVPASVAKKLSKEGCLDITVDDDDTHRVTVKTPDTTVQCPVNGYTSANFPAYEQIIPDNQGFKVSLNVAYLKRLADAITSDGIVTLTFNADGNPNRPINVTGDQGTGVLMPVRQ